MAVKSSRLSPAEAKTASATFIISFSGGSKGGVGKSFFCRALYEYHKARRLPVAGFEGNIRTPDFAGIYTEIKAAGNVVHFSEDENQAIEPNVLLNTAVRQQTNVVVNMAASVEPAFQVWLNATPVLKIAQQKQIRLLNWFVCSGEYDSNEALKASLKQFGAFIPHVVVKNRKFPDWSLFDSDAELHQLVKQYGCKTINFPRLNVRIAGKVLQKRLTYTDALTYTDDEFDFTEQSAIESFLNETYAEIDSTGFFTHAV
jgi:hypothetical protein